MSTGISNHFLTHLTYLSSTGDPILGRYYPTNMVAWYAFLGIDEIDDAGTDYTTSEAMADEMSKILWEDDSGTMPLPGYIFIGKTNYYFTDVGFLDESYGVRDGEEFDIYFPIVGLAEHGSSGFYRDDAVAPEGKVPAALVVTEPEVELGATWSAITLTLNRTSEEENACLAPLGSSAFIAMDATYIHNALNAYLTSMVAEATTISIEREYIPNVSHTDTNISLNNMDNETEELGSSTLSISATTSTGVTY